MSEPKNFLARWSERKLQPEPGKPPEEKKPSEAGEQVAKAPAEPVPEFDISTLPSLDSITPNSDIRVFLQRGVPAELTRAALRRAWSADPAIRDFVGLSENAWDFNAPDSIPGFGSLTTAEVQRSAEQLFKILGEKTNIPAPPENAAQSERISSEKREMAQLDSKPDVTASGHGQSDIAAQDDEKNQPADAPVVRRRHGGALPE
jgi:hypothetical protein